MAARTVIIIALVVVAVAVLGAVGYVVFLGNGGGATGGGPGTAAAGAPITSVAAAYPNAPTGTTFSLGTAGGTVMLNNFYAASGTQLGEDGVLLLKQTPDYWITYDPSDSSFWIAISGSPFNAIRPTAEADFLATLGVSDADACKLDVSVGAPYAASSSMNGQSFPLSFCPGASQ